jgi:D-methionine transport system ATP-binding protein
VAIARALASNPEVLFCDEATSALDPGTTLSILRLIKDIKSAMNITVVMITHQMEVAREVCDRLSVMDAGKIVESGTVRDIFSFPKTEITREFISALKPTEEKETLAMVSANAIRLRLHFLENVNKPILSQLIRDFRLDINILSAAMHNAGGSPVGELMADFSGRDADIAAARLWLAEHGVIAEAVND